jgi:hypothetical protein
MMLSAAKLPILSQSAFHHCQKSPIKIEFKKKATGRPSNSNRLEEKRRSKRTKAFMRSPGKQYVETKWKQNRKGPTPSTGCLEAKDV